MIHALTWCESRDSGSSTMFEVVDARPYVFHLCVKPQGNLFIAVCPEVEVRAFGSSKELAQANLGEAIRLYLTAKFEGFLIGCQS